MKPLPLKVRLSLLVSLMLLGCLLTVSIVAYAEMEEFLLRSIDRTLKAMAEGIWAGLDDPERLEDRQAEFRSITGNTAQRQTTLYRVWRDDSGQDLFTGDLPPDERSDILRALPQRKRPRVDEHVFFSLAGKKYPYRAMWVRHDRDAEGVNILVARSSQYAYHELGEFLQLLLILGGSLMLGALLLIPLIITWGMRPVEQTAARLRSITHKTLGRESLHKQAVPSELKPFVEAVGDMLSRLDRSLQQQKRFTTDASHELRTPLALIKSTLQAVRLRQRDTGEYLRAIDETLDDTERMERLINQLLSLARLDETDPLADPGSVPLAELLAELTERFDGREPGKGRLDCRVDGTVRVRGNPAELGQLFGNLLENALRYGPPDGTVRILADGQSEAGYVTVSIHDEGGQIPPKDLPHLFERFYRTDSSRNHATGGAGLGLAIAREIAHRHGGTIEINSEPASGTTVRVHLPLL
ncbi:MAG: HAMP domain-containing histidine kinase [Sedimentisphaerales bacterium]|nr:HAMP domain-containing histidine kinase [Sedimentisphaerales bacterium]